MSFNNLLMKCGVKGSLRNSPVTALLVNVTTRQGHVMRGKPPGVARLLEKRLLEESDIVRTNIGFPQLRPSRSAQLKKRLAHLKAQRVNEDLVQLARSNKLLIDLDEVQQTYMKTTGQYDLRLLADHYGIFEQLFGSAYFVPRIPLDIIYESGPDSFMSVHNGNVVKPKEALNAPFVSFNGKVDSITGKAVSADNYWTLVATNPDAHFTESGECLHWLVANIPNGNVSAGEVLAEYLPPFPAKGLGYQRMVFVLYKQQTKLDLSAYKLAPADSHFLSKRTFSTLDFYRQQQEQLTPAGLAFYQTNWDESLTQFYHEVLNIKEPIYEYDFPQAYVTDQKLFPLKEPFNLYMDKYRDSKQLNKQYLQQKLAKTHPFEGPEPALRYPNAHPIHNVPSWLKTEKRKQRLRIGRLQDY